MFRPAKMLKVNIMVLEKYLPEVTEAIGETGLVHLADAPAQSREKLLTEVDRRADITELEKVKQRCRSIIEALAAAQPPDDTDTAQASPENLTSISREKPAGKELVPRETIMTALDTAEEKLRTEQDAIEELLEASGVLKEEQGLLAEYPVRHIEPARLKDLGFFYAVTGRISTGGLNQLVDNIGDRGLVLHERTEKQTDEGVLILTSRKSRWTIGSILKKSDFRELDASTDAGQDVVSHTRALGQRLASLQTQIQEHQDKIIELGRRYGPILRFGFRQFERELLVTRAQEHFGRTASILCISGWIPEEDAAPVSDTVSRATGGTGLVEVIRPEEDDRVAEGYENVPVQLTKNALLRPFQKLATAFGAPRYDELEPSAFVAVSFIIMFGLMFGDVGQGALIAVVGLLFRRVKNDSMEGLRDAGTMLALCGSSASVFGFLYGSVFGYEKLIPALWLHPLKDIVKLFQATIILGITFISIGIIINIINKLRAGSYFEGIFDKFGVIGILFYWGSLGLMLKATVAGRLSLKEAAVLVVLPLGILFLREPLYNLLTHKKHLIHDNIFNYVLESAIEIMETVTVFLGSTVSFVRVGAFALSHAALCLAIYAIVEMLHDTPGGGFFSLCVIVAGNALVILLEGMIVTIQGLRLQYYELFSKYYAGDGVLYAPFSLAGTETEKENTEG